MKELVYEDASFSTPQRATKADVYLFTRQTFVEYPICGSPGLVSRTRKRSRTPTCSRLNTNWGHRALFDFKDHDGHRLQGILALPDDYKAGEKRPMLVNFYEKNSQNLHHYDALSTTSRAWDRRPSRP